MRTKNISPYRATCTFRDGRKVDTLAFIKGYMHKDGFYKGLVIIYRPSNGNLHSIGHYDENHKRTDTTTTRKIGHWKEYPSNGALFLETIYIK